MPNNDTHGHSHDHDHEHKDHDHGHNHVHKSGNDRDECETLQIAKEHSKCGFGFDEYNDCHHKLDKLSA